MPKSRNRSDSKLERVAKKLTNSEDDVSGAVEIPHITQDRVARTNISPAGRAMSPTPTRPGLWRRVNVLVAAIFIMFSSIVYYLPQPRCLLQITVPQSVRNLPLKRASLVSLEHLNGW